MTLSIEKIGETRLLCRRRFAARPARLFAAHTDPAIVSRWMTGPEGWTMPVCEIDAREGGAFRYE